MPTQQCFGSDFCQHQASRLVHLPSNTQRFDSAFTLVCLTSAARYLAKQFPLVKFELVGKVTEDFTMKSDKLSSEKVKDFGSTKDALWVGAPQNGLLCYFVSESNNYVFKDFLILRF